MQLLCAFTLLELEQSKNPQKKCPVLAEAACLYFPLTGIAPVCLQGGSSIVYTTYVPHSEQPNPDLTKPPNKEQKRIKMSYISKEKTN